MGRVPHMNMRMHRRSTVVERRMHQSMLRRAATQVWNSGSSNRYALWSTRAINCSRAPVTRQFKVRGALHTVALELGVTLRSIA